MNYFLLLIITLLLCAFFSGMEIAYIASNRLKIELDKKQGYFSSRIISVFVNNPVKYHITILIGSITILVIYSIVMISILEPFLYQSTNTSWVVIISQSVITALLILFVGEFLPLIIFRLEPNLALNLFSIPFMVFYIVIYPVTFLLFWFSKVINKFFYRKDKTTLELKKVFSKVGIYHLLNLSEEKNTELTESENDLKIFQNALDFSSVKVRDCMIPRTEIYAVDINTSVNELKQVFIETGFSKILIYKDSIENITGYITLKSLFKNFKSIKDKVIDISFVPETMHAHKLLEKFIDEKKGMAVVVDEFGGVSGMLTIEDIIEEIFGEIEDEHDTVDLVERSLTDKEFIFSGRLEIDYLNEKYGLHLPESDDYETLAGMIIQYHQNIPKFNELISIESFDLKIIKVSKTRIELVKLIVNE